MPLLFGEGNLQSTFVLSASFCSITNRIADALNIVSPGQSQRVFKYETEKLPVFWIVNRIFKKAEAETESEAASFGKDDYNQMFQVSSCRIKTCPDTSWH